MGMLIVPPDKLVEDQETKMFVTCLDADFKQVYILEKYKSLLWTERYWESGDFDITTPPIPEFLAVLGQIQYLDLGGVERLERQLMELETVVFVTNPVEGDEIVLKGHTLDRKLNGRIVWYETVLSGTIETGIDMLIHYALDVDPDRAIPNFVYIFGEIPGGIFSYFYGEQLDEVIRKICKSRELGFYVLFNEETGIIEFRLRKGIDRSDAQEHNRVIAFTTALNNLLNAKWTKSTIPYKNVCLVIGENGYSVTVGDATGIDRRELFYRPYVPQGELMESEYLQLLEQKGLEELSKWRILENFDGEIDPTSYIFGVDYNMGDILSLADDYDHTGRARITEMIYFQDSGGFRIYPTFEAVLTPPGDLE